MSSSGQRRFLSLLMWQCSKIRTAWLKNQAGTGCPSDSNRLLRKHAVFISGGCWEWDKQTFIYREESVNKKIMISLFPFMILCDFLDWIFYSMRFPGLLKEEREVLHVQSCICKFMVNRWQNMQKTIVVCYFKFCIDAYFWTHCLYKLTGQQKRTGLKKTSQNLPPKQLA